MARLLYTPCKCIKRGDCFIPGRVGHLSILTHGKRIHIRKCRHCK